MFVAQVSYSVPTDDNRMTMLASFRTVLSEANEDAAKKALAEYINNYPYKNKNKDKAIYKSFFIEKKLK